MLTRYKLYVGSDRYKLKSPSFVGKGSFVKGIAVSLSEVVSAHVNVTCFDGGDGFVTVVASGGTPPYQYSLDPTFSTYNTDGVFSNLSLVAPVDEGTDEYGGIVISHRNFYVRDASGQIVSCVVDLKSPVELDIILPDDITYYATPDNIYTNPQTGREYVTIIEPFEPYPTTRANGFDEYRTFWPNNNMFLLSNISDTTIYEMRYMGWNYCNEFYDKYYTITIIKTT